MLTYCNITPPLTAAAYCSSRCITQSFRTRWPVVRCASTVWLQQPRSRRSHKRIIRCVGVHMVGTQSSVVFRAMVNVDTDSHARDITAVAWRGTHVGGSLHLAGQTRPLASPRACIYTDTVRPKQHQPYFWPWIFCRWCDVEFDVRGAVLVQRHLRRRDTCNSGHTRASKAHL